MQLKTTDFVFDITESEFENRLFVIKVKKQEATPRRFGSPDYDWRVSDKTLLISYDTPFLESVQKMIKWAYTEAFA